MHRTRLILAPILLVMVAGAGQPPAPEKKDPQAGFEPRSAPGVGQKFLEKFVGDWEVVKTFHPRGGGESSRTKGECKQSMIHEGRFLKSEFTFAGSQGKTTGLGIIGFEADSGIFTSVWTDSRATRMSFRRGKEKFNGEEIVLHSQSLPDGGGEGRKSRTVTRLESNGAKIVHRQFNAAADGTERVIMELEMTRKPAGAAR